MAVALAADLTATFVFLVGILYIEQKHWVKKTPQLLQCSTLLAQTTLASNMGKHANWA